MTIFSNLVRHVPWMIFFILTTASIPFFLIGDSLGIFIGIFLLVLVIVVLVDGFKKIEASNPASKGLLTIWGERCNVILNEGWHLTLRRFPFFVDFIKIPIEDQNLDFVFEHIRCRLKEDDGEISPRSGGAVVVEVALTIFPDYITTLRNRLIKYINVGGITPSTTSTGETKTKLQDTIRDVLGEAIREEGQSKTWEEMTFAKETISRQIIELLTSIDCSEECDEEYKDPKDIFRKEQYKNGIPDKRGFGSRIRRVNIVRIEVDPESRLSEAAEDAAVEQQEKRSELIQTEATLEQAEKVRKASGEDKDGKPQICLDRALQIGRLERNKNTKEVAVSSSGNSIVDAAALIAAGKD